MVPTEAFLYGLEADEELVLDLASRASSCTRVPDPEDVAESVLYALKQPEHAAVNEVLVQPRDEPN